MEEEPLPRAEGARILRALEQTTGRQACKTLITCSNPVVASRAQANTATIRPQERGRILFPAPVQQQCVVAYPLCTVSNVTVHRAPPLCEVTARPASSVPLRLASVTTDPATGVQVTPSAEVYAVNMVPARATFR